MNEHRRDQAACGVEGDSLRRKAEDRSRAARGARTLSKENGTGRRPAFSGRTSTSRRLSLAGVGFDRTRLKVVADPALKFNNPFHHDPRQDGTMTLRFESVPSPDNPKTAMLACYSALAGSPVQFAGPLWQ